MPAPCCLTAQTRAMTQGQGPRDSALLDAVIDHAVRRVTYGAAVGAAAALLMFRSPGAWAFATCAVAVRSPPTRAPLTQALTTDAHGTTASRSAAMAACTGFASGVCWTGAAPIQHSVWVHALTPALSHFAEVSSLYDAQQPAPRRQEQ